MDRGSSTRGCSPGAWVRRSFAIRVMAPHSGTPPCERPCEGRSSAMGVTRSTPALAARSRSGGGSRRARSFPTRTFLALVGVGSVLSVVAAFVLVQSISPWPWSELPWDFALRIAGMLVVGAVASAVVSAEIFESGVEVRGRGSWHPSIVASLAGPAVPLVPALILFWGMFGGWGMAVVSGLVVMAAAAYLATLRVTQRTGRRRRGSR